MLYVNNSHEVFSGVKLFSRSVASEFVAITNLGSCRSRILGERRKAQYDNEEAQDGDKESHVFFRDSVVNLRECD